MRRLRGRKHGDHTQERTRDFSVQSEGTIFLLCPLTNAAQQWIDENLSPDHMTFGDAVAVEHRYIADIVRDIREHGLEVL